MLASGLTPFAMAPSLLQVVTIIVAVAQVASRAASYPYSICGNSTFTPNSKYQANLNLMATTLPGNASTSPSHLFATAVAGATPDQVWAAGLCRGDLDASSCFSCLAQAFDVLANDCSYIKDATIFYDPCILRYSSSRVLSAADNDDSGRSYMYGGGRYVTSEPGQFNRVVAALINATADYAAHNSTLRFATGEARFNQEVPKVYAVAQCTPDQTPEQCRRCLAGIISKNLGDCENSVGCWLLWISCSYRYQIEPFFNGQGIVQLDLASSNSSGVPGPAHARGAGNNRRKVLIIALTGSLSALFTVLLGCVLVFTRLRRQGYKRPQVASTSKTEEALKLWRTEESSSEFTLYDFTELASATANFSVQNRLGRGGFGPVYKGLIRDGMEIAVKRLSTQSLQGLVEFKNEIQLIAKLQHTNLVRLLGCCVQEEEKMLVYEYMPNGSLDFHIFDSERGRLLNWKKRLHIIEGIALGLLYLHKHSRVRIIHRDLKASNILLDKDLNPKISDFGMARIFSPNITKANTNRVVGTYGYMAPEYASEGIFSVRSDVFSFGVLLLEILCAKKNSSNHQHYGGFINLIGYAWQMWSEGRAVELIDPVLMGNFDDMESILSCIKVALLCVQKETMDRPTMTEVITMLGTEGPPLKDPNQPPYFHLRVDDDDTGGEDRWEAESRPQLLGAFSTNNVTFSIIEEGR